MPIAKRSRSEVQEQNSRADDSPDSPTLLVRKQELVRNAIWDAAIDLFAERGFDETKVEEIVAAAGVSQRTFFRYFDSKADLMGKGTSDFGAALSDIVSACPTNYSPSAVVCEAVLNIAKLAVAYPRIKKLMQIATKYPAANQARFSRLGEAQARVAQAYARRAKHSKRGDFTPALLAAMTTSLVEVVLGRWFESGGGDIEVTVDEVLKAARSLLG